MAAERLLLLIKIGARKPRNDSNARVRDGIRFAPLVMDSNLNREKEK
jgi:hypothetical protein